MKKLMVLAIAAVFAGFVGAARAEICDGAFDHDSDPNTPDGNYCDCAAEPTPPGGPEDIHGCAAIPGVLCIAGDPDESGCLGVANTVAACQNSTDPDPSSLTIPCSAEQCEAAASGGCDP